MLEVWLDTTRGSWPLITDQFQQNLIRDTRLMIFNCNYSNLMIILQSQIEGYSMSPNESRSLPARTIDGKIASLRPAEEDQVGVQPRAASN